MKVFGTTCEILLTIILLFLVPIFYFSYQQELLLQNYVQYQVIYFTDSVRNVGYLNQGMYDSLRKNLDQTNHIYEIELAVYEKYRNSGSENSYLLGTYTDDIIDTIYNKQEKYIMHQGDFISISVRRKDLTMIERTIGLLGAKVNYNYSIPIQYGGMIRDECF